MQKDLSKLRPYSYEELNQGLPCCDRQGEPIRSILIVRALLDHGREDLLRLAPNGWAADGTPEYFEKSCIVEVYLDGERVLCGEIPEGDALSALALGGILAHHNL